MVKFKNRRDLHSFKAHFQVLYSVAIKHKTHQNKILAGLSLHCTIYNIALVELVGFEPTSG